MSNNLYNKKENNICKINSKNSYNSKKKNKLFEHNFLFELTIFEIYIYFINIDFQFINFRNNKEFLLKLNNCCYIKHIVEYKDKKYYIVKKKNYFLATIFLFEDYLILSKLDFDKIRLF